MIMPDDFDRLCQAVATLSYADAEVLVGAASFEHYTDEQRAHAFCVLQDIFQSRAAPEPCAEAG